MFRTGRHLKLHILGYNGSCSNLNKNRSQKIGTKFVDFITIDTIFDKIFLS